MRGISAFSLAILIILAIPLVAVSVANEKSPINNPQNQNRNLFNEVEVQGDVPIPDDPTIVRTRLVNVNFDLLGNTALPAKTVRLNLFDSVVFTAVFDRTETNSLGSYAWIGHLEGIEFGQAVLVVTHGLLAGSVSMPGAIYQIHSIGKGVQVIDEIDQSTFPPEMDPIPVPPTGGNPFDDPEADDACNEISVLVAYTPAARAADGGTAAIEARIALAVSETNQSYVNSGLTQRINLVHVMETNPGDAANNFSADLSALQNTTDGIFDNVDAARETHYADMVGLIIENSSSCGLGYLNSTAGWAFSVTHRTCATGYYSFGHELGHNMSVRHDWYIDNSLNSPFSYSKAFVYINDPTRWRTIMAYNSLCSDTSPYTYCTRLQYWSNPNVFYGGISMGVQSDGPTNCVAGFTTPHPSTCAADNRMALNNTCSSVANFRQSPSTAPDMVVIDPSVSDSTLTPGQTFTIYATAENQGSGTSSGTTLRYYRSTDATISTGDTQIGTDVVESLPAGGTSLENVTVSAPATDGTYYVGACVDAVSGESNTGNQCSSGVQITVSTPAGVLSIEEEFEVWPPAGWTIINNGGDCTWVSNTVTGKDNYTGNVGQCAAADSNFCGSGKTMDTELRTPMLDLSNLNSAELKFISSYRYFDGDEYGDVDISTDGGTTWANLLHWAEDHSPNGPGQFVTIDLTPYLGSNNVIIRFHYRGTFDWWWQIDHVSVKEKDNFPWILFYPALMKGFEN